MRVERPADRVGRVPGRRRSIAQAVLGRWHRGWASCPWPYIGAVSDLSIGAVRSSPTASGCICSAGRTAIYGGSSEIQRNVLGRTRAGTPANRRDPRPRSASVRAPSRTRGHGLLAGKVVLVTAAAGTGIGFATAKRCAEEGARSSQRRARAPPGRGGRRARRESRRRVRSRAVRRHRRGAGPAPVRRRVDDARRLDVRGEQRRARRHRRAGRHDRRAVGPVLDVTLTGTFRCTRAALRHI